MGHRCRILYIPLTTHLTQAGELLLQLGVVVRDGRQLALRRLRVQTQRLHFAIARRPLLLHPRRQLQQSVLGALVRSLHTRRNQPSQQSLEGMVGMGGRPARATSDTRHGAPQYRCQREAWFASVTDTWFARGEVVCL